MDKHFNYLNHNDDRPLKEAPMPKMSTRSGPYSVKKSGQSSRSGPISHGSTTKRGGGKHGKHGGKKGY